MKYAAILFALLFAMTGPRLSAEVPEVPEMPELLDVAGVVREMGEGELVIDSERLGQVVAHLTDETYFEGEETAVGAYVHITTDGTMSLSLPAQITAFR